MNPAKAGDKKPWREYLTRAVYANVTQRMREKIKEQKGILSAEETIPQLIREIDFPLSLHFELVATLNKSIDCAVLSTNPEILQIGIELNQLLTASMDTTQEKEKSEFTEMRLRGKLTGNEDCVQYFLEKAEAAKKIGAEWYYADIAIDILKRNKKFETALRIVTICI